MIDTNSETWLEIKRFIDAQQASADSRLRSKSVGIEETMFFRGVYEAMELLGRLPDRKIVEPVPSIEY